MFTSPAGRLSTIEARLTRPHENAIPTSQNGGFALKKFLIGLIAAAGVLAAAGLLLPAKWKVERSIVVNAPPSRIYPLIANFKTGWPRWSAFDFMDPKIQYTYTGPSQGIGAARHWTSKQGNGGQRIVKAEPSSGIQFELEMEKNKFHITGHIAMQPSGSATKVTF